MRFAVGAMVLALISTLMPALSAVGHTIVTHKQEQARVLRRPFWQRFFLDVMLLVPSLYGYYLLKQRGTLSINLIGGTTSDPFQNPLLFLVPALFVFALGLLGLRLFPWFMSILARLTDWLPSAALPLAFRHLSRSSGYYTGPLMLLILTLGLATFTASMALTLDDHLVDRTYYEVGSDLQLVEIGESSRSWGIGLGAAGTSSSEATEEQYGEPQWLFLPVSQHLDVAGVQRAARVGEYTASATFSARQEGRFVGVDWLDFSRVGFFRQDFATQPLGGLMNLLALDQRALLANRGFLAANRLNVGDSVRLELTMGGERRTVDFIIVGAVDLFPTLYPEDGPVFIGNLDYAFQEMGDEYPYAVWLKTDSQRPANVIVEDLKQAGFIILNFTDTREQIISEQTRPARQGLFGILSVGFLAAAGFTILGFLLYTIFSFRQRYIELGVLRAIGLSNTQMTGFMVCEQLALVAASAIFGTAIGVTASRLFIPFLQVRGGAHPHIPPFIVNIAWGDILHIYAVFGGILLVAVGLTLVMLMRMRVFEVIKLGEMV
jgi:putative ABC transport system permease protein